MKQSQHTTVDGLREVASGDRIRKDDHNSLVRNVRANTIRSTGGMNYRSVQWPQLFDLFDVTSTSYKIRGSISIQAMACLAGIFGPVAAGDYAWVGAPDYWWESGTISDNTFQYCYLLHDIAAQTVTLKKSATIPNLIDDEHHPKLLWYVPWDAGQNIIDEANIYGHRFHYEWFSSP